MWIVTVDCVTCGMQRCRLLLCDRKGEEGVELIGIVHADDSVTLPPAAAAAAAAASADGGGGDNDDVDNCGDVYGSAMMRRQQQQQQQQPLPRKFLLPFFPTWRDYEHVHVRLPCDL